MPLRPTISSDRAWFSEPELADAVMTSTIPPVQVDGGLSFTLPGGVATPDPGSGVWASWRLIDALGRAVDVGGSQPYTLYQSLPEILEVIAPSLTGDAYVACGLSDGPDLSTASGIGAAILYTGGSRVARAIEITTGVASVSDDGTPTGEMRRAMLAWAHQFPGFSGAISAIGLREDGSFPSFDSAFKFANQAQPGPQYFWIAAGRSVATAGEATIVARAKHSTISNRSASF